MARSSLVLRAVRTRPSSSRRTARAGIDRCDCTPHVTVAASGCRSVPAAIVSVMATRKEVLEIGGPRGRDLATRTRSTSPRPATPSSTSSQYYLAVADGALRGVGGRPMALKRFVDGAAGEPFFQKRAPDNRPEWIATADADVPVGSDRRRDRRRRRGRARLGRRTSAASISTRIRSGPRTSTIPTSCASTSTRSRACPWSQVREVALVCARRSRRSGWSAGRRRPARAASTSTSGSSRAGRTGRCAARRSPSPATSSGGRPSIATSKWWKEERHGVFLDYNQNAKDRTVASAYSVRPLPDARVSIPLALGRGRRRRGGGLHDGHRARPLRRARRRRCRDRRGGRVARRAARAERAARGRGPG